MIKLATEGDASYLGNGVYEATAQTQSKAQATFPGSVTEFRLMIRNAGDVGDSFLVKGTAGDTGFTVQYLDAAGVDCSAAMTGDGYKTGTLAPGQSVVLTARATPTVATLGASYRGTVTAASIADPSRLDQVKTEAVVCGAAAAVVVSVPPDLSGVPGAVVNYPYTVTNVGSGVNTFTLSVNGPAEWGGTIYADDGAGGGVAADSVRQSGENRETASTGPLQPGQSYRFFVSVTIPQGSLDGSHADTRLAVTGDGAGTSDAVTTSALAANISVADNVRNLTLGGTFASSADAYPGDTLEYRMSVTNSGQWPATGVAIDTPLPPNVRYLPGTAWVGTSSEGTGSPCPAAACGTARESGGNILARLGTGATDVAGGALAPGKTFHVFFRVQVD